MYGGDSGATAGQDVAADSSSEFVPTACPRGRADPGGHRG